MPTPISKILPPIRDAALAAARRPLARTGPQNLERIGDHTTNIAESVHYMATGHRLNGDRPKGEDLSFLQLRSVAGERSPARA